MLYRHEGYYKDWPLDGQNPMKPKSPIVMQNLIGCSTMVALPQLQRGHDAPSKNANVKAASFLFR